MDAYFPVACSDMLRKIGLLVKARRLAHGLRQSDLKSAIGVSEHTVRKIENGSEHVDVRSFMLVLWRLGLTADVFNSLDGVEHSSQLRPYAEGSEPLESLASRRVRLSRPKPGDF